MKYASKWIAMLLAVLMLLSSLPALAEGTTGQDATAAPQTTAAQDLKSVEGAFAAKSDSQLFLILPNETGTSLYAMPLTGGALTLVDSATQIDEAFCVNNELYYLSYTGASFNVNRRAVDGSRTILAAFNAPQVVHALTWYNGSLYCLVDSKLTRVDLNGTITTVSDQLMEEYTIADGIIYYASSDNQKTYTKESALKPGTTISQSAGCLYQMLLDGTGNVVFYEQGVTSIKAFGDNVYFHNMDKNYNVSGNDQEWLDGLLFRVNVLTAQMVLVSSTYDWDYKPTSSGMVIYRKEQIALTGMDGAETTLYTPDAYSYVALLDDCAIVYEYNLQKLTMVPYNGTGAVLLHEGAFVANNSEANNPVTQTGTATTPTDTTNNNTTNNTTNTGNTTTGSTATGSILYGESGDRVKAMQKRLVELGYLASADGIFGDRTLAAVKAFQRKAGLTVDGIAGTHTLNSLNSSSAPRADKIAEVEGDSSYIFPHSSTKKLTREQILKVDRSLWPYARNEIYARHGYSFSHANFKNYFSKKSWYKEGGFSTKDLNEIEWYNMDLIKSMEKEYDSGSDTPSTTSDYIFPNSSTKKLTKAEIRKVDKSLWAYGRNEIYARHGYSFTKASYKKYFQSKSWYKAGGFSTKDISDIEWYNMDLIKWMEDNEG